MSANAALLCAAACGSVTAACDALDQGADVNFRDGVRLRGRDGPRGTLHRSGQNALGTRAVPCSAYRLGYERRGAHPAWRPALPGAQRARQPTIGLDLLRTAVRHACRESLGMRCVAAQLTPADVFGPLPLRCSLAGHRSMRRRATATPSACSFFWTAERTCTRQECVRCARRGRCCAGARSVAQPNPSAARVASARCEALLHSLALSQHSLPCERRAATRRCIRRHTRATWSACARWWTATRTRTRKTTCAVPRCAASRVAVTRTRGNAGLPCGLSCAPLAPDADDAQCGCTPLHYAVMGGHVECARFLLERGADREAKNQARSAHAASAGVSAPACAALLHHARAAGRLACSHARACRVRRRARRRWMAPATTRCAPCWEAPPRRRPRRTCLLTWRRC
jgi:hypothetical protein